MINTKRLILREMKIEDAQDAYNNWASNPHVYQYLNHDEVLNIEEMEKLIKERIDKKDIYFGIILKDNNSLIGEIGVIEQSPDFKMAEVSYNLSEKYWNKGIITEALNALITYLFTKTSFNEIRASYNKYNIASGKVMINTNMHKIYDEQIITDKFGVTNIIHYAILKKEYLLFNEINEISNIINIKIPYFYDSDDLLSYLKEHLLYEQYLIIDDFNIKDPYVEGVYSYKINDLNLTTYYFFAKYKNNLNNKIKLFNEYNADYIITNTNKKEENIILSLLKQRSLHISFAESCTGGLLAATLINASGASDIINESYVTYAEDAKVNILGVNRTTITTYTVYSKEVAIEMVKGLYNKTHSEVCVSITGKAGGNIRGSDDGSYDFAVIIKLNGEFYTYHEHKVETGTRNEVRKSQVNYVFYRLIKLLEYYLNN